MRIYLGQHCRKTTAGDRHALLKSLDLDVPLVKELFPPIQEAWGLSEERRS
ncbi:hypothetical protein DFAR_90001 [Desulfarculales bacterium]